MSEPRQTSDSTLLPRAPLNEMSFSIFTLEQLVDPFDIASVHGLFAADYPNVERAAPVSGPEQPELLGTPLALVDTDVGIPPRWWFIADEGDRLLQVQERFAAWNWRKQPPPNDSSYRGFNWSVEEAAKFFTVLKDAAEAAGRPTTISSSQVYYDDVIPLTTPSGDGIKLEAILANWRNVTQRQTLGWGLQWVEPLDSFGAQGQSMLVVRMALGTIVSQENSEPTPVLKLTFNASSVAVEWANYRSFFKAAHTHISERFRELLTEEAMAEFSRP